MEKSGLINFARQINNLRAFDLWTFANSKFSCCYNTLDSHFLADKILGSYVASLIATGATGPRDKPLLKVSVGRDAGVILNIVSVPTKSGWLATMEEEKG